MGPPTACRCLPGFPDPSLSLTPTTGATLPPAIVGQAYRHPHQPSPPSVSAFTFSATGLPAGLRISGWGLLTGIPTAVTAATDSVVVTASQNGCQATATYSLTVSRVRAGQVVHFDPYRRPYRNRHPSAERGRHVEPATVTRPAEHSGRYRSSGSGQRRVQSEWQARISGGKYRSLRPGQQPG